MNTEDDNTSSSVNATGTRPPVFDGEEQHYLQWLQLLGFWLSPMTDKEKTKAGSKLILAHQHLDDVVGYMMEVPKEKVETIDGVEHIIQKMNEYFAKEEHLAWSAFYDWFNFRRKKGQTGADFCRGFQRRYNQLKRHDSECNMSERMLSMFLLMQLGLSETNRSLVLTSMTALKKHTCNGVQGVLTSQFKKGLPPPIFDDKDDKDDGEHSYGANEKRILVWQNPDGSLTEVEPNGDTQVIGPESPNEHLSFYGFRKPKGKGKGKGAGREIRHPKEGNKALGQKNGKNKYGQTLTCHDCDSEWHLSGSRHCTQNSMFARVEPEEEYSGFAVSDRIVF